MPTNITGYNANFRSFVKFAENRMATGARKAVANVGDTLEGREITISASKTDAAYSAFSRSAADKTINDQTRALFRKAVADMFGGEDQIPAGVLAKMKIGDYDKGRPLTARRIIEVKAAVDAELAMRAFDDALAKYGANLEPAEAKVARRLFNDHAAGMPATNAGIFARYIFTLDLACEDDSMKTLSAKAERVANDIKAWKDFDYGDAEVDAPRDIFKREVTAYITGMVAKKDFCEQEGLQNISKAFYADCHRADLTINGTHVDSELGQGAITDIFKKAVPNAKAQQLISWTMNQSLSSTFIYASAGRDMEMHDGSEPVNIRKLQGGKLLAGRDVEDKYSALMSATRIKYSLDISEDGKTATVVCTTDNQLMSGDRRETAGMGFGSAMQSIKVTFDLSDPEAPFISGVDISQKLGVDDPVKEHSCGRHLGLA